MMNEISFLGELSFNIKWVQRLLKASVKEMSLSTIADATLSIKRE